MSHYAADRADRPSVSDDAFATAFEKHVKPYLATVLADGKPREFRYIHPTGRIGHFLWTPDKTLQDVANSLRTVYRNGMNAYVTINPIRSDAVDDVMARLNRHQSTEDRHIERRAFIPIDIDPERKSKTLATPEMRASAETVASQIREWIATEFPRHAKPIYGCSGSGYQLLWPCDLAADSESDELIERLLAKLAKTFDTKGAGVDVTVKNRSRIMRVCGTMAHYTDGKAFGYVISTPNALTPALTAADLEPIFPKVYAAKKTQQKREPQAAESHPSQGNIDNEWLANAIDAICEFLIRESQPHAMNYARWRSALLIGGIVAACEAYDQKAAIKSKWLDAVSRSGSTDNAKSLDNTFEWGWRNGPQKGKIDPKNFALMMDELKRPGIIVRHSDPHETIDQIFDTMANDAEVYVLNRELVTISHGMPSAKKKGLILPGDSPVTLRMTADRLFERLPRQADFVEWRRKPGRTAENEEPEYELVKVQPPGRVLKTIENRGHYPAKFRRMRGIVEWPILRPDGTIHDTPGYDPITGFVLIPSIELAAIPDDPTQADAEAAANRLFELVKDFPFKPTVQDESAAQDGTAAEIESKAHSAAWLAALLTIVGRPAIEGPCPGFLIDGNAAATGKSKLARLPALIATGREPGLYTWPKGRTPTDSDDEVNKLLLTVAAAALPVLVFDNVPTGTAFGCAALDKALTSSVISGRRLKSNDLIESEWHTVTFATGINVTTAADSNRRIWRIRLETDLERPENRKDFEVADIEAHALANRAELLRDALLILRAHAAAGRPSFDLDICDYRSWHSVIRDAVYFAAGVDVNAVRAEQQGLDQTAAAQTELLLGLAEMFPPSAATDRRPGESSPFTAKDILDRLKADGGYETLRGAIESPRNEDNLPTTNTLGRNLNANVGTIRNGLRLRRLPIKGRAQVFKLENLSKPAQDRDQSDRVF